MDAHGVQVLDGTHDDAVVRTVADHLHLELLPADQALLDQELVGGRQVQATLADLLELLRVVGNAAARAPQREAGPDDHREAGAADVRLNVLLHRPGLLKRVGDAALGGVQADGGHRFLELQPVLRLFDGVFVGADHLHAVLGQHPVAVQVERAVKRRLSTHGGQHGVGPLLGDDGFHHLPGDGLDVSGVGHARVGHDRGRIAVDEDDAVALLPQRLAGLGPGVVELAGLTDDDGAGADDEDAFEIGALRHGNAPGRVVPSAT